MSVDFSIEDSVATIVLNRPERLNAMDHEHYRLLSEVWIEVRDNPAIRVAVITGAGDRAFSVGADLKSFAGSPAPLDQMWLTQKDMLLNRGLDVFKPIIAAVNGYCLGGGMTLLLATDIRIAATTATFGLSEVKRGLVAANGGTQRILRQLPHAIGMEMLLTGEAISAEVAERWGLVNRVTAPENVLPLAREWALRIAANAPLALQASKELALASYDLDIASGLRAEQLSNRLLQTSQDLAEGTRAFSEKRPPRFQGH
jgi:E-phenylitaconyl-CoA hydratase